MHYSQQVPLFDCGLDLRAAHAVKERIMRVQHAENTVINYRSNWRSFERWCHAAGHKSLPATPDTCIDHASWCIAEGLRLETVHIRLKAVNHYHREAALPLPADASCRSFLRKARRDLQEEPQGMAALTPSQLGRISKAFVGQDTPLDKRDRAMVLLCFALGWRCSEIVSLDLNDAERQEEGLLVHLGKSKTDQDGQGRSVGVHYGQAELTCPVRALEDWLSVRGSWQGPLFIQFRKNNHTVTPLRVDSDGVRRAVKRGLRLIGDEAERFGAHSLRAGMITASIKAGATETAIMQRTGHRSYATLRRYVRPAQAFMSNPLAGVL